MLVLESLGNVTVHDGLGQALDHGGLTHTGLTNQHGVVLGAARENLHDAFHLVVTANHRVQLALTRCGGEVAAELVQNRGTRGSAFAGVTSAHTGGFLLAGVVAGVTGNQVHDGLAHGGGLGAQLDEHLVCHALVRTHHTEQNVLSTDVAVVKLNSLAHGQLENLLSTGGKGNVAVGGLGAGADDVLNLLANRVQGNAQRFQGASTDALALVNQAEQQVFSTDVVVVKHACFLLGKHHNAPSSVGKAFKHCALLAFSY